MGGESIGGEPLHIEVEGCRVCPSGIEVSFVEYGSFLCVEIDSVDLSLDGNLYREVRARLVGVFIDKFLHEQIRVESFFLEPIQQDDCQVHARPEEIGLTALHNLFGGASPIFFVEIIGCPLFQPDIPLDPSYLFNYGRDFFPISSHSIICFLFTSQSAPSRDPFE